MNYLVALDTFHGPLDLLLYLVKRNEVDVLDVPVAKLADQFLEFLAAVREVDVELAGDFLVMAATLMEIKARSLLPTEPEPGEEDEPDPRRELVKQLLEYRRFKDAAAALEERAEKQSARLARVAPEEPARPGVQPVRPVELWDLVSAFARLMRETQALQPTAVVVDDTPQHVYEEQVRERVRAAGRLAFRDLFDPPYHKARLIGLFLAVLELIKGREIGLDQPEPFATEDPVVNIRDYNRTAWDHSVATGNQWTVPVGPEVIAAARRGEWEIILTPTKPVPRDWFPPLAGLEVLCLASGGGQQGPVLAAAGARVTVFDNSPRQLAQDRLVAERDRLAVATVEGDMADLSALPDGRFGLIVHPCSNCFVPDVRPVWREAFRVLRPGGVLLTGFTNPVLYLFDEQASERGQFTVRHRIPYSDVTSLTDAERRRYTDKSEPLCFGHTLADQIGGQLDAGFVLTGFYEDGGPSWRLSEYIPCFAATRAVKPG
ncbi:MAG TPA: segregation/condensation protein A [Fimbriiglobus sp.]|nr:segregation/condensation protein A [Fimbriiglobus sp.]